MAKSIFYVKKAEKDVSGGFVIVNVSCFYCFRKSTSPALLLDAPAS